MLPSRLKTMQQNCSSNRADILTVGLGCEHLPRSLLNLRACLSDGSFYSRLTACYPQQVAEALARVFVPFLSPLESHCRHSHHACHLSFGHKPKSRVEDGEGLISTAIHKHQMFWVVRCPRGSVAWVSFLATRIDCRWWFASRWSTGKFQVVTRRKATGAGQKKNQMFWVVCEKGGLPASFEWAFTSRSLRIFLQVPKTHLYPRSILLGFLDDVREFLDVSDQAWNSALHVVPGQPFRLGLWKLLLQEMRDPDSFILN